MNIGDPWPDLDQAELRVLAMQRKLHHWPKTDPNNLVCRMAASLTAR